MEFLEMQSKINAWHKKKLTYRKLQKRNLRKGTTCLRGIHRIHVHARIHKLLGMYLAKEEGNELKFL